MNGAGNKSFLVLFFKKELLSFLMIGPVGCQSATHPTGLVVG
jgi:hypothetical protein